MLQPYGYTGREYDAESGLYYYRAWNYDPANGVFLQSDPIGFESGQLGLYSYVSSDPFSWDDPSGFSTAEAGLFMGAGGGSAMTTSYGAFADVTSVAGRILSMLKTASKISLPAT